MPAESKSGSKGKGSRRSRSPRRDHSSGPGGSGGAGGSKSNGHSGAGKGNNTKNAGSNFGLLSSMVRGFASSAAAKFTSGLGSDNNEDDKAQAGTTVPGKFDIYLFAQSWAPRFCCDHAKKCQKEGMTDVDDLSPHGLWPAYNGPDKANRTYPAFCKIDKGGGGGRKDHEWSKHGTCTIMTKEDYFKQEDELGERESVGNIRDLLNNFAGESVEVSAVHQEAGGSNFVTLMTSKQCQLQEITTCWEKLPSGKVGKQVECPSHLLGSNRNSAILNGCQRLALDLSSESNTCPSISKDYLLVLKKGT